MLITLFLIKIHQGLIPWVYLLRHQALPKSKVAELLPIKVTIRYKKAYLTKPISLNRLKSVVLDSIELKNAQFAVMEREEMPTILNE